MSYKNVNKISEQDKKILDEIYEELEKIRIPTTYQSVGGQGHSVRTGTISQKCARQTSFGYTNYQGKKQLSSYTKKYPYMMKLFKKFIKSHYSGFKFQSVYVNRNTICKKHLDSSNVGESLLVGFGPYTQGKTVLYLNTGPLRIDIKTNSVLFNGSEIPHKSEPFNGTRYSLVFYK
jgi:hypothetical protein